MKPIKLTMYGFMSYKEKIVIDFKKLYQSRIFVISGDTGSGKTSIFDAISFALFGDISRPGVLQMDLRCDFLTPEDPPTYVNFIFELDGKIYEIERKPSQFAKKKIKAGVKIDHEVEFFELINNDKTLLSDKVGDTNTLIKEILGLDQAQLKKVMLLAQGQFSEFLSASSATKAELLSDIFQTGEYGQIQEILKDKAKSFGKDLENLDKRLEEEFKRYSNLDISIDQKMRLGHDFKGIIEKIDKEIRQKENSIKALKEKYEERNKIKEELIDQMSKAKGENEQILLYQDLKVQKNTFDQKHDDYIKLKDKLLQAKNANSIKPYYERLEEINEAMGKISLAIEVKEKEKLVLEEDFEKLKIEKEGINDLEKEVDRLKIDLDRMSEKKGSLEKFFIIKNQYDKDKKYKDEIKKLEENFKDSKRKDMEVSEAILEKSNILLEIKNIKSNLMAEKSNLNKELEKNKEIISKVESNLELKEKIKVLEKENKSLDKNIKEAKKALDQGLLNQENIEKQKFIRLLNESGVCPICGSFHEEKIEEKEIHDIDLDILRDKYHDISNKKAIGEKEIDLLEKNLILDLPSLENLINEEKKIEEANKKIVQSLEVNTADLKSTETSIEKLKVEKSKLENQNKKLENQINLLREKLQSFDDLERSYFLMKDKLKDLDKESIDQNINQISNELKEKATKIENINNKFSSLDKKLAEIKSFLQTNRENLLSYEKSLEENKKLLDQKIKEYFSSKEEFLQSLETYKTLKEKEEEIKNFFDQYKTINIRLDALKAYKDRKLIDFEAFEKELFDLSKELTSLTEYLTKENIDLATIEEILKEVYEIEKTYKEKVSEGQILKRLSKIASGSGGAVIGREKLDFETFVLIYYFEKILAYSNKRLYKMSNGQYRMVRKTSGGDMRVRQGLDIEIIDSNTGKSRPASTLSGGETFLASLALALGLSDEIAAENGGIKIDTLFIDEGFGSLSENYLQNAIATIEKLSYENKFIGIISHVKEVKDAIDAKILVKYDKSKGSEVEIII